MENLKTAQRRERLLARDSTPASARAKFSKIISEKLLTRPAYISAKIIFSYRAFASEADVSEFNAVAEAAGKIVAYPVCGKIGQMTAAVPNPANSWITDRFGIKSPPIGSEIVKPEEIDLIIVPCVAFDGASRARAGWGGGFYDRYLPKCSKAYSIAVAFELQRVASLARDEWDCPPCEIITEKRVY